MNRTLAVFRNQLALFLSDKGMLAFYLAAALLAGTGLPFFSSGTAAQLSFFMILTGTFLIPLLADAVAGEREKKTLETLLSAPMKSVSILHGKFLMACLFGIAFFGVCTGASLVACKLLNRFTVMGIWHGVSVGCLALLYLMTLIYTGLYQSAISGDTRIAYGKIAARAFSLGFLFMAALFTMESMDAEHLFSAALLFALVYIAILLICVVRLRLLRHADYFQRLKYRKTGRAQAARTHEYDRTSQLWTVFSHEMRYLGTLKMLLLHFLLLCFAPAAFCLFFGEINLNYAVLITALMMPRVTTNLIAYSIGGEKTYKSAESLLSTPLKLPQMFLAKLLVPVVISAAMLLVSSVITLVGANIAGRAASGGSLRLFTADQLVLLFPVGILSCLSMALITGVCTARLKRPRNALYVSIPLGALFVVPPLCIVYLASSPLLWASIYCCLLLGADMLGFVIISKKISRPEVMRWV